MFSFNFVASQAFNTSTISPIVAGLKQMELIAWRLTRLYLGDYYRTYPTTVEDEVRSALARPEDFITGPLPLRRNLAARLGAGFTVRDGEYLSARWPGDAHRFTDEFAAMIG